MNLSSLLTRFLIVNIVLLSSAHAAPKPKVVIIPMGGEEFAAKGQSCSTGEVLTGFDSKGDLVCTSIEIVNPRKLLGRSATTTNAAITFEGSTGIAGARAMCQSSFPSEPSAHLCTSDDLDKILQLDNTPGAILGGLNGVETWSNYNSFHTFSTSNTINNNCHNLAYKSGDIGRGTTATLFINTQAFNSSNPASDKVNFRNGRACGTALPLLCCSGG